MKLFTCNMWGGIVYEPLLELTRKHAIDTDVFCFQEVLFGKEAGFTPILKARINLFDELCKVLSDFDVRIYISTSKHFQDEDIDFPLGQAIFVRKGLNIKENGGFRAYGGNPFYSIKGGKVTGSVEWVEIVKNQEIFQIVNLHGLWQSGTQKQDTPERIIQSNIIKDFLKGKEGKKIICGDFNLDINTESLDLLSEGMYNPVKEMGVETTRSSFYTGSGKFADYILLSKDLNVKYFSVLDDEVSDHLPLIAEFE